MKKYLVGITWNPDAGFKFADEVANFSGASVDVIGAAFPRRQPRIIKYLVVWPLYVWVSLRLLSKCWSYDRVICWQQAYGVSLGLILHIFELFGIRCRAKIDVLTFILNPAKRGGLWLKILDFSLSAGAVSKVVVYNSAEYDCYKNLFPRSRHKFAFTLYSAADVPERFLTNTNCDEYYLAVGRSNRDHEYLRDYFFARPDRQCFVITDQSLQSRSTNFRVIAGVFGDAYFSYLSKCRAVILPFYDPTVSSGQLVYLQAMQLGKPVMVSESRCLEGYLLNGETGLFFDKSIEGLDSALNCVEDLNWYERVSRNCAVDYSNRFGFAKLAEDYCSIIEGKPVFQ